MVGHGTLRHPSSVDRFFQEFVWAALCTGTYMQGQEAFCLACLPAVEVRTPECQQVPSLFTSRVEIRFFFLFFFWLFGITDSVVEKDIAADIVS